MAADFGTVSVDLSVLQSTAEDAYKRIAAYRAGVEAITKIIDSTADFWKGEAGDAYRQVYQMELKMATSLIDDFAAYPKDLLAYAGLYSDVMSDTEATANDVSSFSMEA